MFLIEKIPSYLASLEESVVFQTISSHQRQAYHSKDDDDDTNNNDSNSNSNSSSNSNNDNDNNTKKLT